MSLGHGSRPVRDGLIFHMDLQNTKRSFKGKPTTNLLSNNPMILADDRSTPITVLGNNSNMCQGWGMSVYPNSNVSAETGAEWDPDVLDPLGDRGAWKLLMRPGGNSETQLYNSSGFIIDQTKDYTISVWCKTDTASTFRIHLNVTKDGASNWGHASGYHTGSGQWEKLTRTIPANSGVTQINVMRCQGSGTTKTAEAYFKYFQVEQNSFATRFVNGQRLDTASIVDLTKNKNVINASNITYVESGPPTFDGTDDYIQTSVTPDKTQGTISAFFNMRVLKNYNTIFDNDLSADDWEMWVYSNGLLRFRTNSDNTDIVVDHSGLVPNQWYSVTLCWDESITSLYLNGILVDTDNTTGTRVQPQELFIGGKKNTSFDGNINDFKVYNRALTADEVMKNFASSRGRYGI